MISFSPTEEQQHVADAVRDLASSQLRPASAGIERDPSQLDAAMKAVGGLGLLQALTDGAINAGEPFPRIMTAIVLEELAWGDVNTAATFAAHAGFIRAVAEHAPATRVEPILTTHMNSYGASGVIAAVEPGLRFRPSIIKTAITRRGPVGVVSGTKTLVVHADTAPQFLVVGRFDGYGELAAAIVSADAPGVTIGDDRETTGLTAQRFRDVTFEDVEVDAADILSVENGFDGQRLVSDAWTAGAAILVGLCRAVYEHSIEYTKMRVAHGSVLARKQAVALNLVDMFIDVDAMRWMTWRAACHIDNGVDGPRSPRLAHITAVKKSTWIADEGLQLMGGHGFIAENPVEAWYRNARTVATMSMCFGL